MNITLKRKWFLLIIFLSNFSPETKEAFRSEINTGKFDKSSWFTDLNHFLTVIWSLIIRRKEA